MFSFFFLNINKFYLLANFMLGGRDWLRWGGNQMQNFNSVVARESRQHWREQHWQRGGTALAKERRGRFFLYSNYITHGVEKKPVRERLQK